MKNYYLLDFGSKQFFKPKSDQKVRRMANIEIILALPSKMFNPPPTGRLVQGDQSPTYCVSSPGGSRRAFA